MILKTEGIVLRTLKYQDNNLITTLYTREYGIKSFVIKGYRSAKSRSRHSYFQPLSIIDVVFFFQENRGLHKINESRVGHHLMEAQTDPVKLSLGLTMVEIFFDTVKEEEQNLELYEFLRNIIVMLDAAERRMIQLFIYFLLHLTRYLGFFPSDKTGGKRHVRFRVQDGTFLHDAGVNDEVARTMLRFLYSTDELLPAANSCQQITFDTPTKKHLITTLFEYYKAHIQGFRYPRTMKVFAELFGDIQ